VVYAPPGAFVPPPKVDSQVVGFTRKPTPDIALSEIDQFEIFLRQAFGQRRKQLGGILKNELGAEVSDRKLRACGIDSKIRAEALSFEQVLKLYRA
jgi:16S rRNA (adenine1518-N6/adenine1519-N6)-dimethyltransferase